MAESNGQKDSPAVPKPGQLVTATPLVTHVLPIEGSKMADGQPRILLRIEAPNGSFQFVLDPTLARTLAGHLEGTAKRAETGLVIPGPWSPPKP